MGKELTDEQIQHILQGIRLPPQPQILVDLQMEQAMPDCDLSQVAKLIRQDVSLSGMVLKFVNSPFFGLGNQITSVEQAVALLGPDTVINIINGLSIKGEMSDAAISEMTRFWDTATDIAQVAATIAKQIGYKNADEAYAIGLFHNVGIPLMMGRFPGYNAVMEEAYANPAPRIIDVENRQFNTNHAVVGYYAAKAWNLPRHICEAIGEHHSASALFAIKDGKQQDKKTLLAVLKISEHICGNYRILGQQSEDFEWQELEKEILEYTGLSSYDIDTLTENLRDMGISVYYNY